MATIGAAISGRAKGKEYNMGLFNQRKDTVEWIEYRPDLLFYKWKDREIKKGSHLIIRAGQKAIFYSGGRIHGIFENEGNYDIDTQIIPFLTNISAALHLRSDTGERAEVYFVNSKDLTLNWGTTQRIMIPTPEVPSGIPVGMNGNMVIYFRDYLAFISKVAGVRDSYSINDVSDLPLYDQRRKRQGFRTVPQEQVEDHPGHSAGAGADHRRGDAAGRRQLRRQRRLRIQL